MENFVDPAILFFIFGVFAGVVCSDLRIPEAIVKLLSLYLLMAFLVPVIGHNVLKHFVYRYDAIVVAGAYGSVSAVTFVYCDSIFTQCGFSSRWSYI